MVRLGVEIVSISEVVLPLASPIPLRLRSLSFPSTLFFRCLVCSLRERQIPFPPPPPPPLAPAGLCGHCVVWTGARRQSDSDPRIGIPVRCWRHIAVRPRCLFDVDPGGDGRGARAAGKATQGPPRREELTAHLTKNIKKYRIHYPSGKAASLVLPTGLSADSGSDRPTFYILQ